MYRSFFQNRHLQVKMIKDDASEVPGNNVADTAYIASQTIENVVVTVGLVMLAYVGADTMRQVLVHAATVKIK